MISAPSNSSSSTSSGKHRKSSLGVPQRHRSLDAVPERRHEDSDQALENFKRLEESVQEGNVLMVDQLWLWVLNERTIVTFFPRKEAVFSEGTLYQQGDLHNDIYNEVNSGLESVPDAESFAALIMERAINILLDRTSHRHLQILRIYEESLSILVRTRLPLHYPTRLSDPISQIERMTRSYKTFRREGFSVRPDEYDRNEDGEPMTPDQKHQRDRAVEEQSKEDFSSLLELRDIMDELNTLKKLFDEQAETLASMANHYNDPKKLGETQRSTSNLTSPTFQTVEAQTGLSQISLNGLQNLEGARKSLKVFEKQVLDMKEDCEKTEKAVRIYHKVLLDLAD